jgi:hypothetical protein
VTSVDQKLYVVSTATTVAIVIVTDVSRDESQVYTVVSIVTNVTDGTNEDETSSTVTVYETQVDTYVSTDDDQYHPVNETVVSYVQTLTYVGTETTTVITSVTYVSAELDQAVTVSATVMVMAGVMIVSVYDTQVLTYVSADDDQYETVYETVTVTVAVGSVDGTNVTYVTVSVIIVDNDESQTVSYVTTVAVTTDGIYVELTDSNVAVY